VGAQPDAVGISPQTGAAWVTNFADATVSVLSRAGTVTTITVGQAPFGGAVSPQTGLAWIANSGSNTIAAIGG